MPRVQNGHQEKSDPFCVWEGKFRNCLMNGARVVLPWKKFTFIVLKNTIILLWIKPQEAIWKKKSQTKQVKTPQPAKQTEAFLVS